MKRIRDLNIQFFRCCIVFFGFVALISVLTLKTVSRDPVCKQKVTTSGTINPRWQKIARLKLQQDMDDHLSKSGLVMVQEISTGKILVATAASRQDRVVCDSPITEIVRPYEPGSVIKTLTIATALDQKVLTLRDTFYNTGSLKFGETELMNAVNLQKQ